jgi:hypothetical protein
VRASDHTARTADAVQDCEEKSTEYRRLHPASNGTFRGHRHDNSDFEEGHNTQTSGNDANSTVQSWHES